MLTMGCDWETTAKYLGFTPVQLRGETKRDEAFRREVLRCEAAADLHQIKNLHEASKDPKNWRTSVWWLERTSPVRFAKRPAMAITHSEWKQFLATIANAITEEVRAEADSRRLQMRLAQMTYALEVEHQKDDPLDTKEVDD
jgi:hypothetical protein